MDILFEAIRKYDKMYSFFFKALAIEPLFDEEPLVSKEGPMLSWLFRENSCLDFIKYPEI